MTTLPHHPFTITTIPEGTHYDWDHPTDCPDGDTCDIQRRTRRMGMHDMADLGANRPDGTYSLGRYGFHNLVLIDDQGQILPDPLPTTQILDGPTDTARQVIVEALRDLAEHLLEDTESVLELFATIRRGQEHDNWELAGNQAMDTLLAEHLAPVTAFSQPVRDMLRGAFTPNGCAWCGIEKRKHGRQHTEKGGGWHTWVQPTQQQIKDRMRARRQARS